MAQLQIIRSRAAEKDLVDIWLYVSDHNPHAADELLDKHDRRTRILSEYPNAGTGRDDIRPGVRQLVDGNYLILYRVAETHVEILRVLHARQRITSNSV